MVLIKVIHPILFKRIHFPRIVIHRVQQMASGAKPSVFVSRSDFPKNGIELLQSRYDVAIWPMEKGSIPRDELLKHVRGKDALYISLSEKVDKELLDAAGPQLKVVSTMSVGVDHIDVDEAKARKVLVGYTPGVLTEATAELTVALLLATSRRLFEAHEQIVNGSWKEWGPLWMCGPGLQGSVVGIAGFGRIGQSVAKKLIPFGVSKILYTNQSKAEVEGPYECVDLEKLLCLSDFVIATIPLTKDTRNMFNEERFSLMKRTAIFVNTSRGGIVDQDALLKALESGQIRAAGLDVFASEPLPPDHPLVKLPNCVTLPHIGSASYQSRMAMSELAANNILSALDGKKMPAEYTV